MDNVNGESYIQSIERIFFLILPLGTGIFMNTATRINDTAQIGRLRTENMRGGLVKKKLLNDRVVDAQNNHLQALRSANAPPTRGPTATPDAQALG
jgi:hypothetical protein